LTCRGGEGFQERCMKIDRYLCTLFQKLSDGLQAVTGRTCFFYARVSIWASQGLFFIVVPHIFVAPLCICTLYLFNGAIKDAERIGSGLANPWQYHYLGGYVRLSVLGLTVITLVETITPPRSFNDTCYFVNQLLVAMALYFMACTPKPPAKSLIRHLVEKLKEVTTSVPEPIPAGC
jgi:hypothetical protein